nr:threonine-phosphate decarboxylase CobD [uncultured Rhodopila sp.]
MPSQGSEGAGELRYHGGNINAARTLYPDAPEPWIDLSTGINPVPYPVGCIRPAAWSRLPEAAELAALEAAARAAYGAAPDAGIVAAAGTQALIQWLPRLFPARRVGVLGFTYLEHELCWRDAGAQVHGVTALSELAEYDAGIVVNPNNPDGRMVSPEDLAALAGGLARRGGRLIVDEAFMDLMGWQGSLLPRLPVSGAIVLRSFGKAYGLAGVRLGFAAGSRADCALLRQAMGPWAVSGPAIDIGRRALADDTWRAETASRLRHEAERLDGLLRADGFEVVGGTPLFRLGRRSGAGEVFGHLCRAGILTRPFQARPDWLRFGIPGAAAEWERLRMALPARPAVP